MASGISKLFLPENANELCDRLKLLLQEKQAGIIFDINFLKNIATGNKLIVHKHICTKQHRFLLLQCVN